MGVTNSAYVLIIDDTPDEYAKELEEDLRELAIKTKTLHPSELILDDIRAADLVLVDQYLDDWPDRDALGDRIALQPKDGLALASVLRSHANELKRAKIKLSPTAVAIITAKLREMMAPLPPTNRVPIISRISGVEWIFDKGAINVAQRIKSLASAIKKLPEKWSDEGHEELKSLLNIPSGNDPSLAEDMLRDVLKCIPPVHELSEWSHGISFLRWLLQRIFPYPCFLLGPIHIAARFRLDAGGLEKALSSKDSSIKKELASYEYRGILCDFPGQLWWRSGIESFLWKVTDGRSFEISKVHDKIFEITGAEIPFSKPLIDPVVCYDKDFQPLPQFESMESAVRIWPDDWPAYAEQPWITIEQAKSDLALKALVIEEDRGRIND